mmetsp:Transcript_6255/g.9471  ORF Transcript_6255/g.9471 Transcript_6255/m.9471 type:complete len:480 (-) Transcript_6255:30-1469(-)|eukprot:CAMPEP_0201513920 /NCGR_PEP_ID=MMETSP0161_2-20130828/5876_1 /ASSEMBLY_ACC=CAM_ASM_000251 /TAXON_ID=180227 /ORGANISM="Neoparamoeba aestuarina, Strain SoJaBio B1-5/56/2" /LENGTH=479 /DNA_ID=CAMNT_0047910311 /DNA_START=63 /DNA_END=1502 /DNA_ORIENTATION=+
MDKVLDRSHVIPDHLPGEPPFIKPTPFTYFKGIVTNLILGNILMMLSCVIWFPCLIGLCLYGYPPHIFTPNLAIKFAWLCLTVNPTNPSVSVWIRLFLLADLWKDIASVPYSMFAWYLDEFLFGKKMDEQKVDDPFFEISAGRSGSTQLGHYLSEDPDLMFTPHICVMFPYMWLWKLMEMTAGKCVTKEWVNDQVLSILPPEFLERHEINVWRPDTFEIPFLEATHRFLSLHLGPQAGGEVFRYCPPIEGEKEKKENQKRGALARFWHRDDNYWETDFVEYLDRIMRKTKVYYGKGDNDKRRMFVKGHFIASAKVLAEKYENATFLAMARRPHQSCQSGMNFIHSGLHPVLGRLNWRFICEGFLAGAGSYCDREMEVFGGREKGREGEERGYAGKVWCVVRFEDYIVDLEAIIKYIYKCCWNGKAIPACVPIQHTPRRRHGYSFNRSLADVGADIDEMKKVWPEYYEFCDPVLTKKKEK